jgi:hypothetical protein
MPWRRLGLNPGFVHVGFVVDKVALGEVFSEYLGFSPVNFIPPPIKYPTNNYGKEQNKKQLVTA